MKTQDLNAQELKEINGGSILGNADSSGGLLGGLGIDNLLSFADVSKSGNNSHATGLSIGNGITGSLQGVFSNIFN